MLAAELSVQRSFNSPAVRNPSRAAGDRSRGGVDCDGADGAGTGGAVGRGAACGAGAGMAAGAEPAADEAEAGWAAAASRANEAISDKGGSMLAKRAPIGAIRFRSDAS